MGEELTWLAILASLFLGLAGACVFIFAVKKGYLHNIEDAKYQVFWSDLEEMVDRVEHEGHDQQQGQREDTAGR